MLPNPSQIADFEFPKWFKKVYEPRELYKSVFSVQNNGRSTEYWCREYRLKNDVYTSYTSKQFLRNEITLQFGRKYIDISMAILSDKQSINDAMMIIGADILTIPDKNIFKWLLTKIRGDHKPPD